MAVLYELHNKVSGFENEVMHVPQQTTTTTESMTDNISEIHAKPKVCYRHCCVPGCTSNSRKDAGKKWSFHLFPKEKALRKQWLCKIGRDEGPHFKVTRSTPVCSVHFLPSDFKRSLTGIKRTLVKGAVPSVFNFASGSSQAKKRKSPKKRVQLKGREPQQITEENWNKYIGSSEKQEAILPAYDDHDYAVASPSVEEQLKSARQRIAALEDLLALERKAHFNLGRLAGNDAKAKK